MVYPGKARGPMANLASAPKHLQSVDVVSNAKRIIVRVDSQDGI